MSLGLLPDDLVALLKSQNLGSEWLTLVWDAKGVILARSRDNPRHVGANLPHNMREQGQPVVSRTTNLDGDDVWHATTRSKVSGWGVGVNIPYSLVTTQMRTSLLLWSATGLIAITIASVSGAFFARQITRSLSVAAKAAAAFGRGEEFPLTGSRLAEADAFLVTLNDAQQARQKLTEDLKQFTFAATHDVREPLRMIIIYAQMLERKLEQRLDSEAAGYLGHITKGALRIGRLADGLLDFSRLGELDRMRHGAVDSDVALKEALDVLHIAIKESSAQIHYGHLPKVRGDHAHIYQMFQNLIANALKYHAPNSTPQINISAVRKGAEWIFAVQDNGIGIAPKHHQHIFIPFKRLHGPDVTGAGIGLATCKRIVELYGGRIWVDSAEGAGSTFYFSLPAVEEPTRV
jgi:signal transduction histidine kinase